MRGQNEVIKIRQQGMTPKVVFINDYPCRTDWFETGSHATVCTHGDDIGSMDLRFLAGLTVSISAETENRAKRLFERAKADGAGVVAACHVQRNVGPLDQAGWASVYRKDQETTT